MSILGKVNKLTKSLLSVFFLPGSKSKMDEKIFNHGIHITSELPKNSFISSEKDQDFKEQPIEKTPENDISKSKILPSFKEDVSEVKISESKYQADKGGFVQQQQDEHYKEPSIKAYTGGEIYKDPSIMKSLSVFSQESKKDTNKIVENKPDEVIYARVNRQNKKKFNQQNSVVPEQVSREFKDSKVFEESKSLSNLSESASEAKKSSFSTFYTPGSENKIYQKDFIQQQQDSNYKEPLIKKHTKGEIYNDPSVMKNLLEEYDANRNGENINVEEEIKQEVETKGPSSFKLTGKDSETLSKIKNEIGKARVNDSEISSNNHEQEQFKGPSIER